MNILWVSCIAWKKREYPYPVDGPGAVAGSLFQQQMIEGLEANGHRVDIVADYPYARDIRIAKEWSFSHRDGNEDMIIAHSYSLLSNRLHKTSRLINAIKQKILHTKYDVVVAYLIHTPYLSCLKYAKNKGLATILICPDLPSMMDMSLKEKRIKSLIKRVDYIIQHYLYRYVDAYVLFSKHMTEKLPIGDKPYTVIEGVESTDDLNTDMPKKECAVMHAGTLHRNIGIENIISAMDYVTVPDIKLWIFGDGELKEYIEDIAKANKRIEYKGFVDRNELFEYQKKALALINARNPKDEYTRYSFPSKTFEYLYSGTPYITTKLAGIPNEYDDFLHYIDDNSPKSIAKAIEEIYYEHTRSTDDIRQIRDFLKNNKSKAPQAEKLIRLIEKVK